MNSTCWESFLFPPEVFCNAEMLCALCGCVTDLRPDWLPWGQSVVSGCGGSWPSAPPPSFGWSHQFLSCRQIKNKQHVNICGTEQHTVSTVRRIDSRTVVLTCCRCTEPPSLPADAENWDRTTETGFMINSQIAAALHVPRTWTPPRGEELQLQHRADKLLMSGNL